MTQHNREHNNVEHLPLAPKHFSDTISIAKFTFLLGIALGAWTIIGILAWHLLFK